MTQTPAGQPVTPDPVGPPVPSSADEPAQDPAAVLDAVEERVFAEGDPLDEPAPELTEDQPAVEPPA